MKPYFLPVETSIYRVSNNIRRGAQRLRNQTVETVAHRLYREGIDRAMRRRDESTSLQRTLWRTLIHNWLVPNADSIWVEDGLRMG